MIAFNRRGYQHFDGRGRQAYVVLHSPAAQRRAAIWLAVIGGGSVLIWATSRQEVPYTKRT
jgi:hypothetical protein